jgi:hypothetical protein
LCKVKLATNSFTVYLYAKEGVVKDGARL